MEYPYVTIDDDAYPKALRDIAMPPEKIYYTGDISIVNECRCVAVVGARKASEYGRQVSFRIGERLAENGVAVISGMAQGIDSFAHKGALAAKGKTIAVLGTGIDICYPAVNKKLKEEIESCGLLLSEFPCGYRGSHFSFPLRNRIISGLAEAVVIVEAGIKSGSLITAERAAEQGRTVYAVPGNITSMNSLGTNKLLRDGAIPIAVIDEILYDMKISEIKKSKKDIKLGNDEKKIYSYLQKRGECSADELCEALTISPSKLYGIITVLEMKGILCSSMGKIFIAK